MANLTNVSDVEIDSCSIRAAYVHSARRVGGRLYRLSASVRSSAYSPNNLCDPRFCANAGNTTSRRRSRFFRPPATDATHAPSPPGASSSPGVAGPSGSPSAPPPPPPPLSGPSMDTHSSRSGPTAWSSAPSAARCRTYAFSHDRYSADDPRMSADAIKHSRCRPVSRRGAGAPPLSNALGPIPMDALAAAICSA
eukprot:31342-Pelagococcus_subviridis.AAC.21